MLTEPNDVVVASEEVVGVLPAVVTVPGIVVDVAMLDEVVDDSVLDKVVVDFVLGVVVDGGTVDDVDELIAVVVSITMVEVVVVDAPVDVGVEVVVGGDGIRQWSSNTTVPTEVQFLPG